MLDRGVSEYNKMVYDATDIVLKMGKFTIMHLTHRAGCN